MTDAIADRAWRAAVEMWEANGLPGPRPTREAFAHVPDEVPAPSPSTAPPMAGSYDAATAAAVNDALAAMQAAAGMKPPAPQSTTERD